MSVTVSQLIVSDLRLMALRAPGERGPEGPAGPQGPQGAQGPAGTGIPAGGNDGDMLVRAGIGTAWFATAAFGRSLLNLASAALLRTAIALPTATTAGRLARFTGTDGTLGEAASVFVDAAGNVGLGTDAPASNLHMRSAGSKVLTFEHTQGAGYDCEIAASYSAAESFRITTANANIFAYSATGRITSIGADVGASIVRVRSGSTNVPKLSFFGAGTSDTVFLQAGLGSTSNLGIYTANTERIRISNTGNVGIGTNAPSAKLHVNGYAINSPLFSSAWIDLGTTAGHAMGAITLNANGGLGVAGIGLQSSDADNGNLTFSTRGSSSWSEKLRIGSSGNVGIGTNAPTARLDNAGDTYRQRTARTPASASAAGNTGDICWDANFLYVCVATNTWKRSALATW